jgi:hypothetical protein
MTQLLRHFTELISRIQVGRNSRTTPYMRRCFLDELILDFMVT